MYANLDGSFTPQPGWLDRVYDAYHRGDLAVGGSFHDDLPTRRGRAHHLMACWEWRSTLDARWLSYHPLTNAAVRTEVARRLGGFENNELCARLARFGWYPIRFDPKMGVSLAGATAFRAIVTDVTSSAHDRVSSATQYRGFRIFGRVPLIALAPVVVAGSAMRRTAAAARTATSATSAPMRWSTVPFICLLVVAAGCGRVAGLGRSRRWEAPIDPDPASPLQLGAIHVGT